MYIINCSIIRSRLQDQDISGIQDLSRFGLDYHKHTFNQLRILLVHEIGQIPSIIEDHIEGLAIGPEDGLVDAPNILLVGFPLPGIHRYPGLSHGGSCMVLCGEDVAGAPLDLL